MPSRPLPVRRASLALAALLLLPAVAAAQAPQRGPRQVDPRWHALVGATVVPRPGEVVENATVVVRDGLIVSVTAGGEPPAGARVHDCEGLWIHAGLVEPHLPVEAPEPDESTRHWNVMVMPERSALDGEGATEKAKSALRKIGFTAAAIVPEDGILRGRAAVVALGEGPTDLLADSESVLRSDVYQALSFDRAGWNSTPGRRGSGDPSSEQGAIALLRQVFSDVDWHARAREIHARYPRSSEAPAPSASLEYLAGSTAPLVFDARNELQALRAASLLAEFGQTMVLKGSGTEYRRLPAIVELGASMILPVDFPDEPDVSSLAARDALSLRRLAGWEQAPTNPRRLHDAGLFLALTTDGLDKTGDFPARVRTAIEHGLDAEAALAMVTVHPAKLLGLEGRLGVVAAGALAHLVVSDGPLFAEDTEVRDVWVGGRRFEIEAAPAAEHDGTWSGTLARLGDEDSVGIAFTWKKKKVTVEVSGEELDAREVSAGDDRLRFLLDVETLGQDGTWAFEGAVHGEELHGTFVDAGGELVAASLTKSPPEDVDGETDVESDEAEGDDEAEESSDAVADVPDELPVPFGAYGLAGYPDAETVLFAGGTVWTSGPDGILEDAAVLVRGGKIEYVGPADELPSVAGARLVNLDGKHLTPGIIDCHSHTGISAGVNEMGQRVTAEVTIEDVVDPDDVNWYRQLAGGTTAANQLHGSANAIGGRNAVVKHRWGVPRADDMLLTGAMPGIKFALGENPKRVAAQTEVSDEYPQTRMGVATLIRDRLLAGAEYRAEHERYESLPAAKKLATVPPRRDLELEALAEIMAGERLVHCHSYRQDEILMLCELAKELGFRIGSFQHVLEGYKVAEAILEIGAGASTFSDWWGYKFEVIDAIPHNAGILHDVGVVTSINSDSSDHARRLNTEAGKLVKYSGLAPADALALVTINPAIQLAIDDRTGSIEVGKDADLAVWSGDPLSYLSRCERTFVDGRELFSLEQDAELREHARLERERIIQKLLSKGKPDVVADADDPTDEGDEGSDEGSDEGEPGARRLERLEALLRAGRGPDDSLPGECGCADVHAFGLEQEAR